MEAHICQIKKKEKKMKTEKTELMKKDSTSL